MSAVDENRTVDRGGVNAQLQPTTDPHDIDLPGVLVSRVARLYAHGERERRDAGVERAIARARGSA